MRLALFIESHDLAVKDGPVGRKCRNGFYQGWKPMRQALPVAGPHRNLRIFLHDQSPHSVELQFEQPLIVIERFLNQRCEHQPDDFGNGRTASFLHAELLSSRSIGVTQSLPRFFSPTSSTSCPETTDSGRIKVMSSSVEA